MPSASTTNMPANSVMSHGFWNSAWTWLPASAATAPAAVYVAAMPSTYDSDSRKPRCVDTVPPWPAMMLDRIGTIGSTHGVNDSSSPAT